MFLEISKQVSCPAMRNTWRMAWSRGGEGGTEAQYVNKRCWYREFLSLTAEMDAAALGKTCVALLHCCWGQAGQKNSDIKDFADDACQGATKSYIAHAIYNSLTIEDLLVKNVGSQCPVPTHAGHPNRTPGHIIPHRNQAGLLMKTQRIFAPLPSLAPPRNQSRRRCSPS